MIPSISRLQRKLNHPIKPSRVEKLTLAVLAAERKEVTQQPTSQLQDVMRIFKPETVLRMDLSTPKQGWLKNLILRLARENPRWGQENNEFV